MKNGKANVFQCANCSQGFTIVVNKLYAKESKVVLVVSGVIFLIGSLIGVYFLIKIISEMNTLVGLIVISNCLLIPVWIYSILNKEERNRVRTFNQSYVKD